MASWRKEEEGRRRKRRRRKKNEARQVGNKNHDFHASL
jgi:hypothetical protein